LLFVNERARAEAPTPIESTCSLLIRLPRTVIEPPEEEIVRPGDVDMMVLGTQAKGTSMTRGTMHAALDEESREPALEVTFSGVSTSTTKGANGPAIIQSESSTKFTCRRRLAFHLDRGFVAGPTDVQAETVLRITGIDSDRPGLRGRVVRSVAQRRVEASHDEATAIVTRQTKEDIRRGFEEAFDSYLAGLNRRFDDIRQVAASSSKDADLCMHLAGDRKQTVVLYLAAGDDEVALPVLPDSCESPEVWIRNPVAIKSLSLPGPIGPLLSQYIPAVGTVLSPTPLLSLPQSVDESKWGLRTEGDWLIFGGKASSSTSERLVVKKPVVEEPSR
jgi:hypothetical protein